MSSAGFIVNISQSNDIIANNAIYPIVGNVLNSFERLNEKCLFPEDYGRKCTPGETIAKLLLLSLCNGYSNFSDLNRLYNNPLTTSIADYRQISEPNYRQRINEISKYDSANEIIRSLTVASLNNVKLRKINLFGIEVYALDADVSPFKNEKVNKELIGLTYALCYGFSPIFLYLDQHALVFQLRPGNHHSSNGFVELLDSECLPILQDLNIDPSSLLLRVDSAHDDEKTRTYCNNKDINFIINANGRSADWSYLIDIAREAEENNFKNEYSCVKMVIYEMNDEEKAKYGLNCEGKYIYKKEYYFVEHNKQESENPNRTINRAIRITRNYFDKDGNPYSKKEFDSKMGVKYECEENLQIEEEKNKSKKKQKRYTTKEHSPLEIAILWYNFSDKTTEDQNIRDINEAMLCFELYKNHAESEQYHSEIKTDMKLEKLPSHYFATNKFILSFAAIAFNIMRRVSDLLLEEKETFEHPKKDKIKRIRIGTTIKILGDVAYKLIKNGVKWIIELSAIENLYNAIKCIFHKIDNNSNKDMCT